MDDKKVLLSIIKISSNVMQIYSSSIKTFVKTRTTNTAIKNNKPIKNKKNDLLKWLKNINKEFENINEQCKAKPDNKSIQNNIGKFNEYHFTVLKSPKEDINKFIGKFNEYLAVLKSELEDINKFKGIGFNKPTIKKINSIWDILEQMIPLFIPTINMHYSYIEEEEEEITGLDSLRDKVLLQLLRFKFVHFSMIGYYNKNEVGKCCENLKLKKTRIPYGKKNKRTTIYTKTDILNKDLIKMFDEYFTAIDIDPYSYIV